MRGLRKLGQIVAGSMVIALIATILAAIFRGNLTLGESLKHYRYGLVYSFCIAAPSWFVMERLAPSMLRRSLAVRVPLMVGTLAALALAGSLAANLIFLTIGWGNLATFWQEFEYGCRIAVFLTVVLGVSTTTVEVLQHRLRDVREELRTRQMEEERARQLVTEARLSSLESRIHPHFLFNTLNSITSLIREDPRKAERTVERLAALLRYSLDHQTRSLVPLHQELHVVEDYLEIERTRFGDRLQFRFDVPSDLTGLDVPPLALQTLVENSIKHAIAPNRQGGEIVVTARLQSGGLLLEVSDNGPGFERGSLPQGHGLENLQERLTTLFDGQGRLEIARRDGRMVVAIVVPQKRVLV